MKTKVKDSYRRWAKIEYRSDFVINGFERNMID